MFDLILESKKNKVFRFFNFLLLISFAWVVLINTSYFFEKIIFGQNEVFYDLKLIHNSLQTNPNGLTWLELKDTLNLPYKIPF